MINKINVFFKIVFNKKVKLLTYQFQCTSIKSQSKNKFYTTNFFFWLSFFLKNLSKFFFITSKKNIITKQTNKRLVSKVSLKKINNNLKKFIKINQFYINFYSIDFILIIFARYLKKSTFCTNYWFKSNLFSNFCFRKRINILNYYFNYKIINITYKNKKLKYICNFLFYNDNFICKHVFFKFTPQNILKLQFCYNFYFKSFLKYFFYKNNSFFFINNKTLKYYTFLDDFSVLNSAFSNNFYLRSSFNYLSNAFLNKNLFFFKKCYDAFLKKNHNIWVFNNYYPIILMNKKINNFFNINFKKNSNTDYLNLTNKLIISFFEIFFKKKIFLRLTNNYFYKINNFYFNEIIKNHKNYKPDFFKNFLISDFIEIVWYSFFFKDLSMMSQFISYLMEKINFKNHKKFLNFLQNFLIKYSSLFIDVLKIKGFFFDIRGKVGVTGSSKKRHFCFKFGSLNKSSKSIKLEMKKNLVRTYSGVLGLTYIISF